MMVFLAHLLPTLGLLGLARVSNAYDYSPSPSCGPKDTAKAVYFISNNADNAVVALKVNAQDGKLSQGSVTPTGGRGGNQINAMTGMPAGPDALGSQSALTVAGNVSIILLPHPQRHPVLCTFVHFDPVLMLRYTIDVSGCECRFEYPLVVQDR